MSLRRPMEPEQFGPYTLVRHLATGGMGELYLAQREGVAGFAKQLVVKRIRQELVSDREFVDMFLTEGRVAAMLDHPNVVHLSDLGEVDGIFYMAMEYIAGKDLGSLLFRTRGPLELPVALYIMSSLCEGVAFAHTATSPDGQPLQLVHRDINPQNVLISYQGSVSITDFGIAKVRSFQINETRAGVLKGKFGYLAPEQARSGTVDHRTDIYALGLMLFEVSTGQRAIPGRSDTELLYAAAEGLTQRPTVVTNGYPPRLEKIYLKATANFPEQRYQSARELQDDLLKFQMEQRMVVSSSRLAELMQRTFAAEFTEERRLVTSSPRPPSNVIPVANTDRQDMPAVLESDGSPPKERSVRQFVNAPTIHDMSATHPPDTDFGVEGQGMDGETVTDLPPYEQDGVRPIPSDVSTSVKDVPDTASQQPLAPVDPILASAETRLLDQAQATAHAQAALETRLLDRSQSSAVAPVDSDERVLQGNWTEEEISVARPPRSRLPIILASTLVTLGLAAAAGYYFLVLHPAKNGGTATKTDAKVIARAGDAGAGPDAAVDPVSTPLTDAGRKQDAALLAASGRDAAPTPRTPDAAAAAVRPTVVRKGRVRVSCTPPVHVYWRGRSLGKTPVVATIRAGRQKLSLRDTKLGIRVVRKVTVKAGGQTVLKTKVEKGVLVVKARPWAHVAIDGVRRGTTPIKPIRLYEGRHRVTLVNTDKKQRHNARVVIKPGEVTKIVHRFK